MLKKYSVFFIILFFLSCQNENRTLSIRFANYTNSTKRVSLIISPLIEIDQDIKVLDVIPSWHDMGNFRITKGMHIYRLKCEGISTVICDSFNLKADTYFTVTLRNDLNKYSRKDSLNISIVEKDSFEDDSVLK